MSLFVDECNLNVHAGDGGAGAVSVRREAHVPLGGPDGGDGGKGGDVWLVADRNIASLLGFRDHPHRRAESGVHGQGKKRHGRRGDDLEVPVPEGTVVHDFEGKVLADLVNGGDRWMAAAGGRGGRGNARFLSNRRRAPSFAEQGEHGEERWMRLVLKLTADVALVGYPNVGKSTLISRVSAAQPKIADYLFTTLVPNLGVVRPDGRDDFEFVVADIPGLIEGASEGKGLGHQFLRHIERARVLVVLLDLAGGTGDTPAEQLRVLLGELGNYQPDLLDRPRIIIGSRADVAVDKLDRLDGVGLDGVGLDGVGLDGVGLDGSEIDESGLLDGVERHEGSDRNRADDETAADDEPLPVSAVTGEGLPTLVGRMADAVRAARATLPPQEIFVVHRPVAQGFRVEREDDGGFRVVGREAERAVALSDLTNLDALDEAHARLRRLGIDKALAKAGARDGNIVRIGALSFSYERDEA